MGIYDRDYYRKDGGSFLGSLADQGRVTLWLIGVTVVVFLAQFGTTRPDEFGIMTSPVTAALELNVDKVYQGEVWRLLTVAFVHDTRDPFHILVNMLVLYMFGRRVEDHLGPREYLAFYLVSGVLASLAFVGASAAGLPYAGKVGVGASGAVTAVLVFLACLQPRLTVLFMFLIPMPIWGVVAMTVGYDLYRMLSPAPDARVGYSAHLGGAAFAFCYYKLAWRLTDWMRLPVSWRENRARPSLRVYREDEDEAEETPTPRPQRPAPTPAPPRLIEDEQLEAQVDTILEKIQRVGMDGLSDTERKTLMRASELMKRRRS